MNMNGTKALAEKKEKERQSTLKDVKLWAKQEEAEGI